MIDINDPKPNGPSSPESHGELIALSHSSTSGGHTAASPKPARKWRDEMFWVLKIVSLVPQAIGWMVLAWLGALTLIYGPDRINVVYERNAPKFGLHCVPIEKFGSPVR